MAHFQIPNQWGVWFSSPRCCFSVGGLSFPLLHSPIHLFIQEAFIGCICCVPITLPAMVGTKQTYSSTFLNTPTYGTNRQMIPNTPTNVYWKVYMDALEKGMWFPCIVAQVLGLPLKSPHPISKSSSRSPIPYQIQFPMLHSFQELLPFQGPNRMSNASRHICMRWSVR